MDLILIFQSRGTETVSVGIKCETFEQIVDCQSVEGENFGCGVLFRDGMAIAGQDL